MRASLGVSIVTYRPDLELLARTLATLRAALRHAEERGLLGSASVSIVDNGSSGGAEAEAIDRRCREALQPDGSISLDILRGHGNIGYGRGNNLAVRRSAGDYHLILNPDVELDEDAISEALEFMERRTDVGVLSPHVRNAKGETLYLCKNYPAVLDLLLRGFAPAWLARLFRRRLERYELRDTIALGRPARVPLISGCFMFFRKPVLDKLGGFAPEYFLYFEDFDLSLRAARLAEIVYVPSVRILHYGGYAAKKGIRHIGLFCASALRFYRTHGWKLA